MSNPLSTKSRLGLRSETREAGYVRTSSSALIFFLSSLTLSALYSVTRPYL